MPSRRSALLQLILALSFAAAAVAAAVAAATYALVPVPIPTWLCFAITVVAGGWVGNTCYCFIHSRRLHGRRHRPSYATALDTYRATVLDNHDRMSRWWSPAEDAEERALSLFESLLTPQQREEWKTRKRVTVPLKQGGHAVIVGETRRIMWYDCPITPQCVHPVSTEESGRLPDADTLLAQLLWLRNDPNHLRKIGELPLLPQLNGERSHPRS